MAITRGQMQRQLRRGGGIMNIAPREQFGLGSKLKRAVRKIIPNEVAKVATVAAPFVAPFNPALAGAMAGIGSFDQTGSLSDAFKRGALTYGGGQLARYAGGAGFQGNPFASGGAFTTSGFTSGFSSPFGTETGIGKLLSDRAAAKGQLIKGQGVQPINAGTKAAETAMETRDLISAGQAVPGADPGTFVSPLEYKQFTPSFSEGISTAVTESAPESVMKAIKNKDYGQAAKLAAEKGFNAVFKKPIRNDAGKIIGYDLDKNTLFAAGAFGLTYLDAKKVADEAGVDIGTETEYDEATKAAKKEEYADYLTNFFEGKKDGGRIGFDEGANTKFAMIKDMLAKGMDESLIMSIAEATQADIDSVKNKKDERTKEAQGGRIGFSEGRDVGGVLSALRRGMQQGKGEETDMSNVFSVGDGIKIFIKDFEDQPKITGRGFQGDGQGEMEEIFVLDDGSRITVMDYFEKYGVPKNYKKGGRIGFAGGTSIRDYAMSMNSGRGPITLDDFINVYKFAGYDDGTAGSLGKKHYKTGMGQDSKTQGFSMGGRIGYMFGDKVEDSEGIMSMSDEDKESILPMKEEEDMKMAGGITFNKRERAYLYKRLGSSYTSGKSKSMPNLFYILNDPGSYPQDAAILKRIAIMGLGGKKDGGRIELGSGSRPTQLFQLLDEAIAAEDMDKIKELKSDIFKEFGLKLAKGGRINYNMGSEVPIRKNKAGIEELDYRESGGFVPVGVKEKADDVPAMLSKNEFVLTADAVRGIGGGDVEKGAEKLYGVMKQAEKVGRA